eukprot:scaffold3747_cov240-Pinguiococcus_pyrenoidosus.AAC.2
MNLLRSVRGCLELLGGHVPTSTETDIRSSGLESAENLVDHAALHGGLDGLHIGAELFDAGEERRQDGHLAALAFLRGAELVEVLGAVVRAADLRPKVIRHADRSEQQRCFLHQDRFFLLLQHHEREAASASGEDGRLVRFVPQAGAAEEAQAQARHSDGFTIRRLLDDSPRTLRREGVLGVVVVLEHQKQRSEARLQHRFAGLAVAKHIEQLDDAAGAVEGLSVVCAGQESDEALQAAWVLSALDLFRDCGGLLSLPRQFHVAAGV